MDIFDSKNLKPMLIGKKQEPFDSDDYIYELKLDGIRTIAYLDPNIGMELRSKGNININDAYPELAILYTQVKERCILDGEIIVMCNGRPDLAEVRKRIFMTNKQKIIFSSVQMPASFIAFDILYYKSNQITNKPLMERKSILQEYIALENDRLSVSRYIKGQGCALFELTGKQRLEGIVAKKISSLYYPGKVTKDWIKSKHY